MATLGTVVGMNGILSNLAEGKTQPSQTKSSVLKRLAGKRKMLKMVLNRNK
jgi:hypothetical protein